METVIRPETEMKDSGVQWISDIPNNWNVKPLYACLDEINQKNNPVVTTNILSLTNTDGVIPYSERGNQGNKSKENFEEYKVVYPDTIVANSMNILIGSVGLSQYEGCVSPVYYVYAAKPQVDIRYMNYLFQMEPFQKRLRQFANGILEIRLRVSSHDILHQKVAVPAYDEQQAIADYLDETCSKIDEIIAEAKASIDEYKELKQSVIFEAVTKGLDKNVKMKDSGIEWIGEIPVSWDCEKMRYIVNDIGDIDHYMPESVGYGIAYLMTGDLSDKVSNINFEKCKQVSYEDYKKLSKKIKAEIGDIIFARYASIGIVCYVDVDKNFLVSYSCVVIKPKHDIINSLYVKYYLQSKAFKEEVLRLANSNVQMNVGKESLLQAKITVPSLYEQEKIVNFLDKKTAEIDSLIAEKESLINDLEAYKKSLIYEVVTGKRRVV